MNSLPFAIPIDRALIQREMDLLLEHGQQLNDTVIYHEDSRDNYIDRTARRYEAVGQVYDFDSDPNVKYHDEMIRLLNERLRVMRDKWLEKKLILRG